MSKNGDSQKPQLPWRVSNSNEASKTVSEGSERLVGQPNPPRQSSPLHPHQSSSSSHHPPQHRERLDRDRDKNHETVCNLLSMLTLGMDQPQGQETPAASSSGSGAAGGTSALDQNRMLLLNLTNSPESCIALRRAGCIPLLIEILHPPTSPPAGIQPPEIIKTRAARALKNIVQFNPDEKLKRKELRVLKLLEGIRAFSEAVRVALQALGKDIREIQKLRQQDGKVSGANAASSSDDPSIQEKVKQAQQHPTTNMTTLMKLSFDEEHRNIMCLLGAIHALADLIVCDHMLHGNSSPQMKDDCMLIRRYSGMTLTNLTFGDGTNKALLCGMRSFMDSLVSQLECDNEDVCQVTASVLRNLSWHADSTSRACLRDSSAVPKLTLAAIKSTKESTLKATLSALWNLSAHSVANKSAICSASPESLPFLISLLRPNNPLLKTLKTPMTIIENAGGILRNISSQISTSPEHRKILRENHCYEILLEHLKSCSLTVVSNACGTLWNLSGGVGCEEDQRKLLDLNAVPMLKNLIYSKHERISQGASAALRNLLSSRFAKEHMLQLDSRLTAQIYSPNAPGSSSAGGDHHLRNCLDSNQDSPGSDGEFDFEFHHHQHHPHGGQYPQPQSQQQIVHHPPMVHQHDPPVAHQHSSAAVASIFHRIHSQPTPPPPPPSHFHVPPPAAFPHPGNYMSRPTSINYSLEPEPLDLTLTSAKSSPIHIISAAEFGGMTGHHHHTLHHSHPHQRKHVTKSSPFTGQFHTTTSGPGGTSTNQKQFFNPPSLLHHTGSSSQCSSPLRFNIPGQKFNRSCPEILSRLNSGHSFVPEQKPLDFSSNSHSTSSSLRGAGEATGQNDSANGGDTTFNYSLQFTEVDEDDRANASGNGEGTSKSEDTLKTYCYEGTPHNFSISNSCQDLVHEIEMEKQQTSSSGAGDKPAGPNGAITKSPKLQPIDETPKSYYVENTPAVFSRTSSLSSINSSGGLNAGENKAEPLLPPEHEGKTEVLASGDHCDGQGSSFPHSPQPPHPIPRQRKSGPHLHQHGTFTPGRVTFSAEETPLMFSRCSSVASLDSLDVPGGTGGGNGMASNHDDNDDNLSDFSRRASEVVSPSDLPDSPRAMAPPVRIYEQQQSQRKREDEHESKHLNHEGEDDIKVFTLEEKSGLNSCRSLSPLMIDGEVLPVLGKRKLEGGDQVPQNKGCSGSNAVSGMDNGNQVGGQMKIPGQQNRDGNTADVHLQKKAFPDDEVKVFAMEGTPFYGVSNATSLSDLTMDLDNMEGVKEIDKQQHHPLPVLKEGQTATSEPHPIHNHAADKMIVGQPEISQQQTVPCKQEEEPIYSDVQLLQKCIRIGKSVGIPKSKSEYKIIPKSESTEQISGNISSSSNNLAGSKVLTESKSQNDFDDPDLAALIMKGRNRPKEKERSSSKSGKLQKGHEPKVTPTSSESENSKSSPSTSKTETQSESSKGEVKKEDVRVEVKEVDEKTTSSSETEPELTQKSSEEESSSSKVEEASGGKKTELKPNNLMLDPSQISTTSLGSEWNDETPTFSSPIPSMSISTAFKIVGGPGEDESSCSKQPHGESQGCSPPKHTAKMSMQSSLLTMSIMNNELLENVDPPSTFSNVISSSDCILQGSPPLNHRLQGSCSDKLSRKWKALNDAQNTSSIHSNLSGQRPPLDLDLENSMISVASIKSEIYELSSTASYTNDIFQSAMEDVGSPSVEKAAGPGTGDHSLGGNTYTIFPPEMGDNGNKSTDVVSEGGNTVVSDDFTDAEEIEDFETAPADDNIDLNGKVITEATEEEKTDAGKPEVVDNAKNENVIVETKMKETEDVEKELAIVPPSKPANNFSLLQHQLQQNQPKPLMEVHPLDIGKYNTFKIQKSPISPKSSPKQKRRDDPERYKTRTIAALNAEKGLLQSSQDTNGNPLDDESRFATFRVGGPKVLKPVSNVNSNTGSAKTSQSNSPESTPGNSPKGIRGRRKPLYSSLPPSAIHAKKKQAPPIPPKPGSVRNASPVRPPSSGSGSVYVRPTRTSELRCAANSRDSSPGRVRSTSRSSSNSSLNNLTLNNVPTKMAELESTFGTAALNSGKRPKVAPKPPVRTTPSATTTSSSSSSNVKPFSGSTYNVVIKTSNSSFGFGQQKIGDGSVSQNMKGYSTLPKSSKLGGDFAGMYMPGSVPPSDRNGESKESIPGSEKSSSSSSHGKMNKLTNLFKRMDFHRSSSKEIHPDHQNQHLFQETHSSKQASFPDGVNPTAEKKSSSKFSFFRKRDKDKSVQPQPIPPQPKPFLDSSVNVNIGNTPSVVPGNTASIRGTSGIWVRRDGENKAMVAPFNYVPPPNHPKSKEQNAIIIGGTQGNANTNESVANTNATATLPVTNNSTSGNTNSATTAASAAKAAAAGSAKITTV